MATTKRARPRGYVEGLVIEQAETDIAQGETRHEFAGAAVEIYLVKLRWPIEGNVAGRALRYVTWLADKDTFCKGQVVNVKLPIGIRPGRGIDYSKFYPDEVIAQV